MQKTTVKIIKLINGDDIVTVLPTGEKQLPDNGPLIRLDKPLQIKYVPQITPMGFRDYIAMIRWTNYTNDKIVTIPKDKILTITNASVEMTNNYFNIAKNYNRIENPPKDKTYSRESLSLEQNEKINEIFREFEDEEDDGTPPTIH
mgnify:CR=1 FL=1